MSTLLLAHLLAALAAPLLVRFLGPRAFAVLALVPAATALWAAGQIGPAGSAAPRVESVEWIPVLGLDLAFRMDSLAALLTLVVSGIGALVLLYSWRYFAEDAPSLGLFAASLTGFAGAMLGLVTADDLLALYVFWEITTVLSFLLIGYHTTATASRAAAKQALVLTTAGGLVMLVGLILIGEESGSYRISRILADPGSGAAVEWGVALLLVGAITKSALVPFHFWLPGAMAAPTPVSAYLHAAAMVKAGVYLVARFAPAYADLAVWRVPVLTLGVATLLVGAYRAMRQHDLKLVLAYGTVSQLGFLVLLLGSGTRAAALAGITLLLAHALFKSTLFLAVGVIEHATGTRDLRDLDGLHRRLPWLLAGCVAAGLSMAGLPPLLGFVGKEIALAALTDLPGLLSGDGVVAVAVVLGSTLTVAYTARFLYGAFGPGTRVPADPLGWHPPPRVLVAVPVVLGGLGVVTGLLSTALEPLLLPYVGTLPEGGYEAELGLWHGLNLALLLSVLTWVAGGLLFWARQRVSDVQRSLRFPLDTGRGYQRTIRGLDRAALEVTGFMQSGSLPALLSIILGVLVLLPLGVLVGLLDVPSVPLPRDLRLADSPAQMAVAAVTIGAAVAAVRARRRLRAVFLVGMSGYGLALLFLLHGAPDLALTQILVETVTLVVFVLVLRRLSGRFPDDPPPITRRLRALLGAAVAAVVGVVTVAATQARNGPPSGLGLVESAVDYGGGYNIVNVILVDTRAWDTMGELSVVLAAATGVASLVFLRRDAVVRARKQLRASLRTRADLRSASEGGRTRWLASGYQLDPRRRSTIFEVVTRLVFHTIVLWSLYLLFSGHNNPGGGFAAGLVAGLALALRYLAGRGYELRVAAPVMPGLLLGSGLFVATASALLPMAFGEEPLRTWIVDVPVPVLGEVHLVTSVLFDIGVYLVVVGLMLDVLRSLGSALDDQIAQEQTADDGEEAVAR